MTIQIITLIVSTLTGFIFKYLANKQKDEADKFKMLIQEKKQIETSIQNARSFDGGVNIRRLIVVTAFSILAFIYVGSGFIDGPTSLITTIEKPSYLFGLFGGGKEIQIKEIYGMIYNPEELQIIIISIIGFYFGQSPANRN